MFGWVSPDFVASPDIGGKRHPHEKDSTTRPSSELVKTFADLPIRRIASDCQLYLDRFDLKMKTG